MKKIACTKGFLRSLIGAVELHEIDGVDDVLKRGIEIEIKPPGRELLERLRQYRGRLPTDFTFSRVEANCDAQARRPTHACQ